MFQITFVWNIQTDKIHFGYCCCFIDIIYCLFYYVIYISNDRSSACWFPFKRWHGNKARHCWDDSWRRARKFEYIYFFLFCLIWFVLPLQLPLSCRWRCCLLFVATALSSPFISILFGGGVAVVVVFVDLLFICVAILTNKRQSLYLVLVVQIDVSIMNKYNHSKRQWQKKQIIYIFIYLHVYVFMNK